jgi:cyclophilin family peptidyl-prolyl cis-trans isomerase
MKPVLAILGLAIAFVALSVLINGGGQHRPNPMEPLPTNAEQNAKFEPPREGVITAVLSVQDRGDMTIEFYPKVAPKSVAQFVGLIKKGHYDGVLVHRVDEGIVVQFGNPNTKTQGVDARESDDGVPTVEFEDNTLPHVAGAIGIARKEDKDSGTDQLFIDLSRVTSWDHEYAVIGRVVNGMDVANRIKRGDKITRFAIKP